MANKKASSTAKKAAPKKAKTSAAASVKKTETSAAEVKKTVITENTDLKTIVRPGALVAELIGTFLLAAAVIGLLGDKMMVMLALIVIVVVFGVISGAHLNPAITVAIWANRKISGLKAMFYILAQVLGALLAYVVMHAIFNGSLETLVTAALAKQGLTDASVMQYGSNSIKDFIAAQGGVSELATKLDVKMFGATLAQGSHWLAFWTELLGSTIFGLGIGYAVLAKKKNALTTGFAVGGSLMLGLAIGGATVILNPAVAAALGVFAQSTFAWSQLFWTVGVYILATCIGMTAGFTIYRLALRDTVDKTA